MRSTLIKKYLLILKPISYERHPDFLALQYALYSLPQLFAQNWGGDIVGPFPQQQTLGTNNNRPLRFETNGIQRMHINPNGTNYFGLNTSGFIGINTSNPRSMLHLNGPNNTTFGGAGWRRLDADGLFSLENSDNLYVGMKDEGFNRSDAIICFGDDNAGAPTNNLRFMFSDISPNGNDPVLELGRFYC